MKGSTYFIILHPNLWPLKCLLCVSSLLKEFLSHLGFSALLYKEKEEMLILSLLHFANPFELFVSNGLHWTLSERLLSFAFRPNDMVFILSALLNPTYSTFSFFLFFSLWSISGFYIYIIDIAIWLLVILQYLIKFFKYMSNGVLYYEEDGVLGSTFLNTEKLLPLIVNVSYSLCHA